MFVRNYMSTQIVTAHPRDGLHQTYYRMREHGIRHMPVLDKDDVLVGIITERDLRRPEAVVDDGPNRAQYFRMDNETKVGEAMTRDPATTTPGSPLVEPLGPMIKYRYGAMPVLDDEGQVVGILTAVDMLRALRDKLNG